MKAIICAAGTGSRLGLGIPKALVKVCGRPIIEWQLEALRDCEVTVIAGFRASELAAVIGDRARIVVSEEYEKRSICHSIGLVSSSEVHLIVDGDLLFFRHSFPKKAFVGVCYPRSEEPVYAVSQHGYVTDFSSSPTGLEWACICAFEPSAFRGRTGHAYQVISEKLPLPAVAVDSFEVDTHGDLEEAERWMTERM